MKLEKYCDELKNALGANLKSIILYGSAASGEFSDKYSDYNLLLVFGSAEASAIRSISKPTRQWVKSGNPPPLMFTEPEIINSLDVFPIEFMDMRANRKLLYGIDILAGLEISPVNLRHELEYEFRSKVNRLREAYAVFEGRRDLETLLAKSLSSFTALLRAALRMSGAEVPASTDSVLDAACGKFRLNRAVFGAVSELKKNRRPPKGFDAAGAAEEYLHELNKVVTYINEKKF